MLPLLGVSKPASKLSNVVLPEPEAPTIATLSDGLISNAIPFKMQSSPSAVVTILFKSTVFIMLVTTLSVFKLHNASKNILAPGLKILALTLFALSSPYSKANTTAVVLIYGDSISAAYGMKTEQGWVNLLSERLKQTASKYTTVNASVSGETSGGGLIRLEKALQIHQPEIIILELGGNDGLRGYPINKIEANLNAMTRMAQAAGAKVLLIGMVLPPNYGPRYTKAFEALYQKVADQQKVPLLPFVLDGVATEEKLMQGDGIHPRAEAQAAILDDIWPYLEKLFSR